MPHLKSPPDKKFVIFKELKMNVGLQREEDLLIFKISGKVDSITTPEIQQFVESQITANDRKILFLITEMEYISSVGLKFIFYIYKKIRQIKGAFVLVNPSAFIDDLFDIAGLKKIINVAYDLEIAKQYLSENLTD